MPFMRNFPGIAIVGTEQALWAVKSVDQRCQRVEVAGGGTFADHQRHSALQLATPLLQCVALVTILDSGGDVGVERLTAHSWAVAVQRQMAKGVHFVEQRILSGNDAWVIHHFG